MKDAAAAEASSSLSMPAVSVLASEVILFTVLAFELNFENPSVNEEIPGLGFRSVMLGLTAQRK